MIYISEKDFELLDFWTPSLPTTNRDKFVKLLYAHGIDTTKPFEEQENTHRTRVSGEVYTGRRWVGVERLDPAWIKGGVASLDAIIASMGDEDFAEELTAMSREGVPWDEQIEKQYND